MLRKRLFIVLFVVLVAALVPIIGTVAAQETGSQPVDEAIALDLRQIVGPVAPLKDNAVQTEFDKFLPGESGVRPLPVVKNPVVLNEREAVTARYKVTEGWEGVWPAGLWETFDYESSWGEYCWDDENWIAYAGAWSAWPAGGCADGLDPNSDYYANNMHSMMTFGPFSTRRFTSGKFTFKLWLESQKDHDYIAWCASRDHGSAGCWRTSGDTGGWVTKSMDLKRVPSEYGGNMLNDDSVWIYFYFTSDGSVVDDGAFVDQFKIILKS